MNTRLKCHSALLLSILGFISVCFAQSNSFTYQGRFISSGTPFTGTAEMQFTLWDAASNGVQVASTTPTTAFVIVTNGLFTVPIDFGSSPFNGADRWIQIDARTVIGPFTTLQPRQKVTPAPYAIRAAHFDGTLVSAQLAGTYGNAVTFSNAGNVFMGTFTGSGASVTNVNAATVGGFTAGQFWKTSGNAGTAAGVNFIGTTDNQPLEGRVNGQRVARWERPTNAPAFSSISPNFIGGFASNSVASGVNGATIAGGGGSAWYGATLPHAIGGDFSSVGGGVGNVIYAPVATIAGGERGTVGTNGYNSFLGGGAYSFTDAGDSVIGGGRGNSIQYGGYNSTIGGGSQNSIQTNSFYSVIGGGSANTIQMNSGSSTIAGGNFNTIKTNAGVATIGGGYFNVASGYAATVPGGYVNSAVGQFSFAAGQQALASHNGSFVWSDASSTAIFPSTTDNQFSVRAYGGVRLLTSGAGLTLDGVAQATSFSSSGPGLSVFGDIALESSSATYHHLRLSGGNSTGFLYGSFPYFGDGVHLGYNFYADAAGSPHVINGGGGSSRVTAAYGEVVLGVGSPGFGPNTVRLRANLTGVTVTGTFNNSSDRNGKQDFQAVSSSQILEKVARLPITEWSYKEDATTRHIGPVAQDFYAAFNIGTDEKHIAPLDEGGVALAAIQGLNQKLEAQQAENAELKRELAELKKLVQQITRH